MQVRFVPCALLLGACLSGHAVAQTFHPVTELGFPSGDYTQVINAADVFLGNASRFVLYRPGPGNLQHQLASSDDLASITAFSSASGVIDITDPGVSRNGVDVVAVEVVDAWHRTLVRYSAQGVPQPAACVSLFQGNGPFLSRDGRTVLYTGLLGGINHPFIERDGVCELVAPDIADETVYCHSISPDGETVAGRVTPSSRYFVWTRGTATRFLPWGGWFTSPPTHVSNGGARVVGDNPPPSPDLNISTYGEGGWRFISWLPSYQLPLIKFLRDDGTAMGGSSGLGAMYWSPTTGEVSLAAELSGRGVNLRGWTLVSLEGESADRRRLTGLGYPPGVSQLKWWVAEIEPFAAADIGQTGGVSGGDGRLDNNDFIVFIDRFFAHDQRADVGGVGGTRGGDGTFDNNDFVEFVELFFSGAH